MRPVKKGLAPISGPYTDYRQAKPELISRVGAYCSYCERNINSYSEIEHILPKSLYPSLIGDWNNFLLVCKNCNSTKGAKNTFLANILLPDRDNTFVAYIYKPDGSIEVSPVAIAYHVENLAKDLLHVLGLDKPIKEYPDMNGKMVAIDRVAQRMNVWLIAEESKKDLIDNNSEAMRRQIVRTALAEGFFSIWMTIFSDDTDMKNRLIDAFPGTRESGCFDSSGNPISPAPNPDGLSNGGKI